jgi:ribosomal protein L37AE/L43A
MRSRLLTPTSGCSEHLDPFTPPRYDGLVSHAVAPTPLAPPFPRTLPEFQSVFTDEATCRRYLVESRWPDGFSCPNCGADEGWERGSGIFICRRCRTETSVTAGTVLDHTHLPLVTWFWAAYLVTTTSGLNALSLGRQLGLTSRKTTHAVMRRLRRSMSALALPPLAGTVEAGETVVGGVAPGARGSAVAGTGRRIVLAVVEGGGSRTRLVVIPDRKGTTLVPLLARLVVPGATIVTDGHSGYAGLTRAGYAWTRIPLPSGGLRHGEGRATPSADGAITRYKRWQLATYHKPPVDCAPYLDEFCFRSEFRGDPEAAFSTLLGLAVGAPRLDHARTAPQPPAISSSVRPIPTREQRVAARRAMLDFSMRRQRPGSGSMLHELMKGERPTMNWWRQAAATLDATRIPIAVTGANAANAYMPPRATGDLDLALRVGDLAAADEALTAAGWEFLGNLQLYEGLRGTAWRKSGNELDLIGLPGEWGRAAIRDAQDNLLVAGLPTLTLPYVVAMKLISARPQDSADISRMLGPASDPVLNQVSAVVRRRRPQDAGELDRLIALGKLEWSTPPPAPKKK